jgi:hypothetical protein
MSRINVDAIALSDARFARLAHLLGLADGDHARSKVEYLWLACTLRGETELPQWLVEQYLGERGPAALIESELGRWGAGRGDSKTRRVHIAGSRERCLWMRRNQEQAANGGITRARNASRDHGKFTSPGLASDTSPDLAGPTSPLSPARSPALAHTDPDPPLPPRGAGRRSKPRPDLTPTEQAAVMRVLAKLSELRGGDVAYEGAKSHVRLIVHQLREGRTEAELYAVIAHCCDPKSDGGEGWKGNPEMHSRLRPETLFGPENIEKYLPEARVRYRTHIARKDAELAAAAPQPPLSLDGGMPR